MNIRLVTSAPFPWLNAVTGMTFGKRAEKAKKNGAPQRRSLFSLPRSLTITREGKWFIGVLLLVGIAAINTGNNLLYLVVAAMLSFIIVSGVLSESTIRGIRVERRFPRHLFKGQPVAVRYRIENGKKRLPSYSFNIAELAAPGFTSEVAYVLKLKARAETVKTAQVLFERRGSHLLRGVRISTRFPFGLFLKGREEPAEAEVVVYPAMRPPSGMRLKAISANVSASDRDIFAFAKGSGTELRSMRDYAAFDDARFIYWKSAAKGQKLLMKEFEKETERKVIVLFDNYCAKNDDPAFEDMVDEAAGVINHFIERGFEVGLKTLTDEALPAGGGAQLFRLLKILALLSPVKEGQAARLRVFYI